MVKLLKRAAGCSLVNAICVLPLVAEHFVVTFVIQWRQLKGCVCWGHLVICNDCSDLLSLYQLIKKFKLLTVFWWWGKFVSRAWDWKSNWVFYSISDNFAATTYVELHLQWYLGFKSYSCMLMFSQGEIGNLSSFYSESVKWPSGKQLCKNSGFQTKVHFDAFRFSPLLQQNHNQHYHWLWIKTIWFEMRWCRVENYCFYTGDVAQFSAS